ncbi:hypothetical protein AAD018_013690 [Aestuariibius insulae]|uniref:hypothetical protein n=1 Tax=Aestuariibius insulae TaxID=2058287 RepID=UPI00345E70F3
MGRDTRGIWGRSFAQLRRRRVMLAITLYGGLIAYTVVRQMRSGFMTEFGLYEFWVILSGMLGSAIAYQTGEAHLGFPGWQGAVRALATAVWVALFGAVVAGTLALPGYGTIYGPISVAITLVEAPVLLVVLAGMLAGAHLMMLDLRKGEVTDDEDL